MTKRYKIKQWFKKHFNKDKIMPIILTLIIALIVGLCIYFENKDMEQQKQKHSDITLHEDIINANTSFIIDNNGNLVGENLCTNIVANGYVGDYYMANILPNTTYSIKAYGMTPNILNYGVYLYLNGDAFYTIAPAQSYNTRLTNGITFTTPESGYPSTIESVYIKVQYNVPIENVGNVMINEGAVFKDWEPYGLWYSQGNYNLNGTLKYNEGLAEYQKTYYYFNNKTASVYYDNGQYDGQHLGDILLTQTSYTNYTIDITSTLESWVEDISRADAFRIDIPMNLKSSEVFINASWPTSTADGYFKVYYDDGTSYNVPQTTFSSGLFVYDGSSTNSDKYVLKVSYQIVYDVIDTINITTSPSVIYYNNGYNEGYDIGFSSGVSTGQSNGFTNGYNNGYQIGYNEGATKDLTTNGFQTLCNSILSYPVNLISKVFNFEFMGINIASTIFFLISCGIVLWIIKRLWK